VLGRVHCCWQEPWELWSGVGLHARSVALAAIADHTAVLLRSIWTALRIIFDFKRTEIFKWLSIVLGTGLPALFLAVVMPISGVSYRLYNVCIPNGNKSFQAWFVWLLAFAGASAILLTFTILFCLWKFALSAIARAMSVGRSTYVNAASRDSADSEGTADAKKESKRTARRMQRVEWARIKRVLHLQWRTILLAFIILNETIFFGLVFVQQNGAFEASSHGITTTDFAWGECLITTGGNKDACLKLSGGLGLSGPRVVATLLLLSVCSASRRSPCWKYADNVPDSWHSHLPPHGPLVNGFRLVRGVPASSTAAPSLSVATTQRWQSGLHHARQQS
jgi:hypothetical protein